MSHCPMLDAEQPDLFVTTPVELHAEVREHGSGIPPRYPAPPIEDDDVQPDFSPVQVGEAQRAIERATGTVRISVIPLERIVEFAEKRGML